MSGSASGSDPTYHPDSSPVQSPVQSSSHRFASFARQANTPSHDLVPSHLALTKNLSPGAGSSYVQPINDDEISDSPQYRSSVSPRSLMLPSNFDTTGTNHTPRVDQLPVQLIENPFTSEPTYFTRSNRYFGPPSTWRGWTENDQAIATALDREKGSDLSRHLYNAFVLRRNAENHVSAKLEHTAKVDKGGDQKGNRNEISKGKERVQGHTDMRHISEDENLIVHLTHFKPPRRWTAWPLPPDEVPRENFLPSIGVSSFRMDDQDSSTTNLEDCLIAVMTKQARTRWESRSWEEWPLSTSPIPSLKKQDIESPRNSDAHVETSTRMNSFSGEESGTSSDEAQAVSISAHAESSGIELFSSQAIEPQSPSQSSDSLVTRHAKMPAFMADDAQIRKVLLPAARHLISKLDLILSAAHVSRQSYSYRRQASQSRSKIIGASDVDEMEFSLPQRGRQRAFADKESDTEPPSRSQSRPKSFPFEPRDWSTVIGLASIVQSFTPSTIARAGERCAQLFDGNMLFRTFHEAEPRQRDLNYSHLNELATDAHKDISTPWFTDHLIIDDETDLDNDFAVSEVSEDGTESDLSIVDSDKQETVSYMRKSPPCRQCQIMKAKCEVPTFPQRPNDLESSFTTSCERCIRTSTACSGIACAVSIADGDIIINEQRPSTGKFCPFPNCPRYTIPFQRASNLKRHIAINHKHEQTPSFSSIIRKRQRSGARTMSRSPMRSTSTAPPHDEAFYCPIDACVRSKSKGGKPFQTGSRMYTHVRKWHTDVDIDMVKRGELIRRGERRGRWTDERRHRNSRSVSRSQSRTANQTRARRFSSDDADKLAGNEDR